MGCGISKIDPDEAGTKFKSLPKRKVDSHAIASQHVSDDLSIPDRDERKSASSPIGNNERRSVSSPVGNKGEYDQAQAHQQVNAKKAAVNNCKEQSGVGNGRKYNKEVAAKAMTAEEEKVGHRNHGNEEDKGSVNDRDDSIACPGSPSFREYCVSDGSGTWKGKNEDRIGAKGENNKSPIENNIKSQAEGSLNSEMGSEQADSTKKRRPIGRGMKNAMYRPAGWVSWQK